MLRQLVSHRTREFLRPKFDISGRFYATSLNESLGPRRALVYKNTGEPSKVIYATTNTQPVDLRQGEVAIRFLLSPINPANVCDTTLDLRNTHCRPQLNTIEGTYPSKPNLTPGFDSTGEDVFIGGNEGVAEVVKVAPNEPTLKEGDWVVMKKAQSGTWTNWRVMNASELMRVPRKSADSKVTEVFAATMMVRTPFNCLLPIIIFLR